MPEYHGWTHAPKAQGGTDPIPGGDVSAWAWMERSTDLSTPNNTPKTVVAYDDSGTSDASVLEVDETNGMIFIHQPGIYLIAADASWTASITNCFGQVWSNADFLPALTSSYIGHFQDFGNNGAIGIMGFGITDDVNASNDISTGPYTYLTVTQNSGSGATLNVAHLQIARVGSY